MRFWTWGGSWPKRNMANYLYLKRPSVNQRLFIYVIKGAGLFKIGQTGNVQRRFNSLQACSPVKLVLAAYWDSVEPDEEKNLHERFKAYRSHGEWFSVPPALMLECVAERTKRNGTGVTERLFRP